MQTRRRQTRTSQALHLAGQILRRHSSTRGSTRSDMVALSGAHTIGQAQCGTFKDMIYNETNIDTTFATSLRANCPRSNGDGSLANLDMTTANTQTSCHRRSSCTRTRCCSTTTPLTTLYGTSRRTQRRSAAPSRRP
ncbi:hypothetical protein ACQJBY_013332 [Aegilops geniculata]